MPWAQAPSLAVPRFLSAAATGAAPAPASGSSIYVIGGTDVNSVNLTTVEAYDPGLKTWSKVSDMHVARSRLGAAWSAGLLHAVGGVDDSYNALATHEVYDPTKNQWSTAPSLPSPRDSFAAVTGSDGLIYVIGGSAQGGVVLATVEAYDPQNNTWVPKAQMSTARAGLAATATTDGHIYAIGGINTDPVNTVEVYDIAADKWTTSSYSLPAATGWLGAATGPNGLIYAIGGMTFQGGNPAFVASMHSFNPASGVGWVQQAPLPDLRGGQSFVAGPDGLVYAISGMTCPADDLVPEVDAYTYDKCDYILYEISLVEAQIAAFEADAGELPPKVSAEGLAALRAKLAPLEAQLKYCRG